MSATTVAGPAAGRLAGRAGRPGRPNHQTGSVADRIGRVARSGAPRTPFVLLVLGLLTAGLVLLLLVNTASASGSFGQRKLQDTNNVLVVQQQELQRRIQALDTPQHLAAAARALGMVVGGDPAFIEVQPDGSTRILGNPTRAIAPPPPPPPPPVKAAGGAHG